METGTFSSEEVEALDKLRVSEGKKRDQESPEYQERLKKVLTRGVQLFNTKPSAGIQYVQKEGLVGKEAEDIAEFLLKTPNLNKTKIGDLIGGKSDFDKEVLREFVGKMDFTGLEFDVALRRFLQAFRLPGEAQIIDRIMEAFSKHYYEQNSGTVFANEDAIYVLAFSTIMLNTDAHNSQVKDKMTKAQWLRQNKGINDGADLPQDFLEKLYDKIVEDEIKMESGIFTNAEKKGWLTKQGGRIKTWKRRWFILSEAGLYYFKQPQDSKNSQASMPCGIVMLDNVEVVPNKAKKNSFMLKVMDTSDGLAPIVNTKIKGAKMEGKKMVQSNHDIYIFCADSQEEMESWITALNSCINHNPFYSLIQQKKGKGNDEGKEDYNNNDDDDEEDSENIDVDDEDDEDEENEHNEDENNNNNNNINTAKTQKTPDSSSSEASSSSTASTKYAGSSIGTKSYTKLSFRLALEKPTQKN